MMYFGSRLRFSIPRNGPKTVPAGTANTLTLAVPSTEHFQRTVTLVSTSAGRVVYCRPGPPSRLRVQRCLSIGSVFLVNPHVPLTASERMFYRAAGRRRRRGRSACVLAADFDSHGRPYFAHLPCRGVLLKLLAVHLSCDWRTAV